MINPTIEVSDNHPLSDLVTQAASGSEIITLTANGLPKAVVISVEAFEYLVKMKRYKEQPLMPDERFHQEFHSSLVQAGYDSREKIINLVQEVKQEMAAEREQKSLFSSKDNIE
jgi:prevent-host-death family protein